MRQTDAIGLLETRIRKLIGEFNSAFHEWVWRREWSGYEEAGNLTSQQKMEYALYEDQLKTKMEDFALKIYRHMTAYIELYKMPVYLDAFINDVSPIIKDPVKIIKGEYSDEHDDVFSTFVDLIWQYFDPICAADDLEGDLLKSTSVTLLENMLEHTAVTMQEFKITPERETDISLIMNKVCKSIFPDAQFPTESFQKTASYYKPDILVPALRTAIEYKVANEEKELAKTIGQVYEDVSNYSSNRVYKLFYAVFYVKPGCVSKKRFQKLWSEREFPDNWRAILVEGPIKPKRQRTAMQ